jgi:NosR/NirI family nitrous oxide reductase transcriptional regulator
MSLPARYWPLLAILACSAASAALPQYLAELQPGEIVPGATQFDSPSGEPPVAVARSADEALGWVFLNSDFVSSIGYSGRAINIVVGIDRNGVITGARLVEHHEPIVLIGIPESRITQVLDDYIGLDIVKLVKEQQRNDVDIVSGATVTVMVMDDSIVRAAIKVARRFSLGGLAPVDVAAGPKAVLDTTVGDVQDWIGLVGDGSVRRLKLSIGEVNAAFERGGNAEAMQRAEPGAADDVFIEMYVALVSIPAVGKSLLGELEYRNLDRNLAGERHAILIAADGRYSFKGSGYVRGGIFDRFHLIQGDDSIRFHDRHHKRLRRILADGAPRLAEVDLFELPADAAFDGAKPWTLELLIGRATGPTTKAFETFELAYQPPQKFLKFEAAPDVQPAATPQAGQTDTPLWHRLWLQKIPEIVVLIIALGVLTVAFFFQNWLVQRQRLTEWLRTGFLIFIVVGIGFYANAQLSVVIQLGVLPDGAIDLPPMGRHCCGAAVLGPRCVLWLVVPVRRVAGIGEQGGDTLARAAVVPAVGVARAPVAGQVHRLSRVVRRVAALARLGRATCRGRTVQDRHHSQIHARMAIRGVRRCDADRWAVRGAILLPLPVRAGRGTRHPREAAHVRVAETLQRMRQALPALCQ